MRYLLDTNVISELRRSKLRSDPAVRRWVSERSTSELHLSAVTILEIELGIARIARKDEIQATRLQTWFEDELLQVFKGRILPIDVTVARRAARLHDPDPRPERDALIAATAIVNGLTLVTRNIADFEPMGLALINPWVGR